ncbi:hypothetical protein E3N88_19239 [Mikania micrantha]|uniref:Uncharacterized protein n=1 Tax=Mikania micrantha TaxID=192012 RepID=A0A5N6NPK1_9ASTR|nr:hypothetical protein E3N88_19239 [Mikania micrantha]
MRTRRIPKLVSFVSIIVNFFSSSRHHQKLIVHHVVFKHTREINHVYVLLMFLVLSFYIATIFSSGSSKLSNDSEEPQRKSNHSPLMLELYHPLPLKVDEEILDETYSLPNIVAQDDQEFIPRLVHLELIKGAIGSHDDYKVVIPDNFIDAKLITSAIKGNTEIIEFQGYDDDNVDEGDEVSVLNDINDNDDDLTIRIEEFIAMNTRKWREEMLKDKFLYLEY